MKKRRTANYAEFPTWAEMCELEWKYGATIGSRIGLGLPPRRPLLPRDPKPSKRRAAVKA